MHTYVYIYIHTHIQALFFYLHIHSLYSIGAARRHGFGDASLWRLGCGITVRTSRLNWELVVGIQKWGLPDNTPEMVARPATLWDHSYTLQKNHEAKSHNPRTLL